MKKSISRTIAAKPSAVMQPIAADQEDVKTSAQILAEARAVKTGEKDALRWAGAFRDDPFWEEMMAFIKAERAEIDAAQK